MAGMHFPPSAHVLGSPPALQAIARLPDVLKTHPLPQASFRLGASISERNYDNVYPRANDLLQVLQNTQIPGADFQVVATGLLTKFIGARWLYACAA